MSMRGVNKKLSVHKISQELVVLAFKNINVRHKYPMDHVLLYICAGLTLLDCQDLHI